MSDGAADRPWCWRVRFYWRAGGTFNNLYESSCDGAFPAGTTAMEAIAEVAKWRNIDLATAINIEAELLIPDTHKKIDWTRHRLNRQPEVAQPHPRHPFGCDCYLCEHFGEDER